MNSLLVAAGALAVCLGLLWLLLISAGDKEEDSSSFPFRFVGKVGVYDRYGHLKSRRLVEDPANGSTRAVQGETVYEMVLNLSVEGPVAKGVPVEGVGSQEMLAILVSKGFFDGLKCGVEPLPVYDTTGDLIDRYAFSLPGELLQEPGADGPQAVKDWFPRVCVIMPTRMAGDNDDVRLDVSIQAAAGVHPPYKERQSFSGPFSSFLRDPAEEPEDAEW